MAKWCGRSAAIDDSSCLRPASIAYFIKHAVQINGSMKAHIFAVVHWFEYHPSRYLLGDPVELWCQLHESLGPASFLPIQRIHSKFVAAIDKFDEETLLVVMPLSQKVFKLFKLVVKYYFYFVSNLSKFIYHIYTKINM